MQAAQSLRTHLNRLAVLSSLYVWAYFVTAYLVSPLQAALLPSVVMSLLFLPHGLRVLAAWLYGWRSLAYLLPGALLCNLHFAGPRAFDPEIVAGTLASLLAAPLAFLLVRRAFPAASLAPGDTRLHHLVATGILASLLNLSALKLAFGLAAAEGAVILLGDTAGLLLTLALASATLRLMGRRI